MATIGQGVAWATQATFLGEEVADVRGVHVTHLCWRTDFLGCGCLLSLLPPDQMAPHSASGPGSKQAGLFETTMPKESMQVVKPRDPSGGISFWRALAWALLRKPLRVLEWGWGIAQVSLHCGFALKHLS